MTPVHSNQHAGEGYDLSFKARENVFTPFFRKELNEMGIPADRAKITIIPGSSYNSQDAVTQGNLASDIIASAALASGCNPPEMLNSVVSERVQVTSAGDISELTTANTKDYRTVDYQELMEKQQYPGALSASYALRSESGVSNQVMAKILLSDASTPPAMRADLQKMALPKVVFDGSDWHEHEAMAAPVKQVLNAFATMPGACVQRGIGLGQQHLSAHPERANQDISFLANLLHDHSKRAVAADTNMTGLQWARENNRPAFDAFVTQNGNELCIDGLPPQHQQSLAQQLFAHSAARRG